MCKSPWPSSWVGPALRLGEPIPGTLRFAKVTPSPLRWGFPRVRVPGAGDPAVGVHLGLLT